MRTFIAIDPGLSGGIAWSHSPQHVAAEKMPATEGDIINLLREIVERANIECDDIEAHIEAVPVGMFNRGAACSKLNGNAGFIRGALAGLCVRTLMTRPAHWQKQFQLGTRSSCASDTVWKNKLKAEAQRRFPNIKVTLATADALLILEHGRKTK